MCNRALPVGDNGASGVCPRTDPVNSLSTSAGKSYTVMYLTMECASNSSVLQQDLDRLSVREPDWAMEFNPSKCQVVQNQGSL